MNLLSALSVSASGMAAQRERTELLVENLANADTTRTPEGGPYRRKDVVFASDPNASAFSSLFDSQMSESGVGVRVAQVVQDTSEPEKRYMPGHPDADADGYVAYPKMNPAEDMVDLLNASRTYQANVSAISAVKDMVQKSMELFK
jgi:flagellar basal-body rod protein FlgC